MISWADDPFDEVKGMQKQSREKKSEMKKGRGKAEEKVEVEETANERR
jgi:hypothetical protein